MIGYYNYTVWLTYIGMASGVTGLACVLHGGKYSALFAVICLLFSGFCDLFDGRVARMKKNRTNEERKFGIQIDSLSDLICFGVLPTAIGYAVGLTQWYWLPLFCLYILTGLIRLAYYNVSEESRQKKSAEVRHYYEGLPITSAAITFPIIFCLGTVAGADKAEIFKYVYAVAIAVTMVCFVAPIRVVKPRRLGTYVLIALGGVIGGILLATWMILA